MSGKTSRGTNASLRPNITSEEEGYALPADSKETAQYIMELTAKLRQVARGAKLDSVMVALELAYCEAFSAAHREEPAQQTPTKDDCTPS
jgi:hypothetical protein